MDKKPVATLSQRYGLWKHQELALYEDELRVCYRSGPNVSHRSVPLDVFDTNESHGRVFTDGLRHAFVAAAGGAVLFLAIAAAEGLQRGTAPAWSLWVGAGLAAGAAAAGAAYVALAYDAIYFYHAYTGDFLCALVADKPDRAAADAFCRQLKAQAKLRGEKSKEEAESPSFGRELIALHELRQKQVISDEEFGRKKEELIDELMKE